MERHDLSQEYFRWVFTIGLETTNNHYEQPFCHGVIIGVAVDLAAGAGCSDRRVPQYLRRIPAERGSHGAPHR